MLYTFLRFFACLVVPPAGIEPALLSEPDFESGASTSSAKGALACEGVNGCRLYGQGPLVNW
jgi:hypothetical protein